MGRGFTEGFRRYFFRGLVAFLPLVLTFWVLGWMIRVMERAQSILPSPLRPDYYLPYPVPGVGAVFTLLLILAIGFCVTHLVSHKAHEVWNRIVRRIPIVRSVYGAIQQVVSAVVSQDREKFRRVVLLEYPRKDLYAIGLVTGPAVGEIADAAGEPLLSVYVPKAPNPTNGWYAVVPERETIPLAMTVEEAFKVVMSAGLVMPDRPMDGRVDRAKRSA